MALMVMQADSSLVPKRKQITHAAVPAESASEVSGFMDL